MEKKTEKRAEPENVKNQLEALAGKKLDLTPEQIISLRYPVGAIDQPNGINGTVLWKSIIIVNQSCQPSILLDASGATFTGSTGSVTFLLSSFVCVPTGSLYEPVNVQATVRSTTPFFLTMTHTLVADDPANPSIKNDVQITVNTWDADGNPAPSVSFDWRCRVAFVPPTI